MTTDDRFGRDLSAWLEQEARGRVPSHLNEVLVRTVATRQRPWWSSPERWLPVDLTASRAATRRVPVFRLAVATLLLLLAVLGLALYAGSRHRVPAPFGPAANGDILLWQAGDIVVADKAARGTRVLIGGPENDFAGYYTHDGTHIVFLRGTEGDASMPMLADADGRNVRALLPAPLADIGWLEPSPADDRLALIHEVDGLRTLGILDIASGQLRNLSLPEGAQPNTDVYWRPPDGAELVFTTESAPGDPEEGWSIAAIHPDGSGFRTVLGPRTAASVHGLTLAPDGATAAYHFDPWSDTTDDRRRIHFVDLDTGVDHERRFVPTAAEERSFVYAPDGEHGFVRARQSSSEGGNEQLLYVTLDGSAPPKPIGPASGPTDLVAIGFSPDGTTIFVHYDNSRPRFYDIATGQETTGDTPWGRIANWQRIAP